MQVEHHDLPHEFPEFKQVIHDLKISSSHFARLLDEYEQLTNQIEDMEDKDLPVDDFTMEEMKKKRLKLKDELYTLLTAKTN